MQIEADFQAFEDTERSFRNALQALNDVLAKLERDLNVHLAEWDGPARRAYQEAADSWHASARNLAAELDRLHRHVGLAHRNFRTAHEATLRMWTPL
ncbi:WXG100 family type VII secretion target [Actinomadura opuntiae]|uniref:WXG100 family type VII secretion target n=1 Tax=Actinomadura sp. OS1-43 TaxID=604315 RepID=UPI00255ABFEC|nr:WXG100 family type VII secretion target [Actinomadura sp. OS1-43]MDL4821084.1 WXG100 family type VII secretion target [Actinomadura sp. OS1-43]